jgi:hypothetical protein
MLDIVKFNQHVQAFKETLEDEDEKRFFAAVLWIAWILTAQDEDLEKKFKESFTPDQAGLVLAYASGSWSLPPSINTSIRAHTLP